MCAIDPLPNYTLASEYQNMYNTFLKVRWLLDTAIGCNPLESDDRNIRKDATSTRVLYQRNGDSGKYSVRVKDIYDYVYMLSCIASSIIDRREKLLEQNYKRYSLAEDHLFSFLTCKDDGWYFKEGLDKAKVKEAGKEAAKWKESGWDGEGYTKSLKASIYTITTDDHPIKGEYDGKVETKTFVEWDLSVFVPFMHLLQERIEHMSQFLHPYCEVRIAFEKQLTNYPTEEEIKHHKDVAHQDYTIQLDGHEFSFCKKVLHKQLELAKNWPGNRIDLNKLFETVDFSGLEAITPKSQGGVTPTEVSLPLAILCYPIQRLNSFLDGILDWLARGPFLTKLCNIAITFLYEGRSKDSSAQLIQSLEFKELCGLILLADCLQYTHLTFLCEMELIKRVGALNSFFDQPNLPPQERQAIKEKRALVKNIPLSEETKRELKSTYSVVES